MLSVELKINGTPISTIYAHRKDVLSVFDEGKTLFEYYWEHHPFGRGKDSVSEGTLSHHYEDGLEVLVSKILGELTE